MQVYCHTWKGRKGFRAGYALSTNVNSINSDMDVISAGSSSSKVGICTIREIYLLPRWVLGSITIVFAAVSGFLLPDYPRTTKWLSPEQQSFAEWRLAQDIAGEVDDRRSVGLWKACVMALTDYRLCR